MIIARYLMSLYNHYSLMTVIKHTYCSKKTAVADYLVKPNNYYVFLHGLIV